MSQAQTPTGGASVESRGLILQVLLHPLTLGQMEAVFARLAIVLGEDAPVSLAMTQARGTDELHLQVALPAMTFERWIRFPIPALCRLRARGRITSWELRDTDGTRVWGEGGEEEETEESPHD